MSFKTIIKNECKYTWKRIKHWYMGGVAIYLFVLIWEVRQFMEIMNRRNWISLADCYVMAGSPAFFGMLFVPYVAVQIYFLHIHDFNVNHILRNDKIKTMFFRQTVRNVFVSILYMITLLLLISVAGCSQISKLINWNKPDSWFCYLTKYVWKTADIIWVIIPFCVIIFLRLLILTELYTISMWFGLKPIIGLGVIYAVTVAEMWSVRCRIFLNMLSIGQIDFLKSRQWCIRVIIYTLIWFFIIWFIVRYCMRKKEFLRKI